MRRMDAAIETAMATTDEGVVVPEEMRETHLAQDLRKPKRQAPYYLEVLMRRAESMERLELAAMGNRPTELNIGTVNVVQVREYPQQSLDIETKVIEVTHAIDAREVAQGDERKHQDGDGGGKAAEAGGSNRLQQGR